MKAVLDVNVLVSALISRDGTPARVLRAWVDGHYELLVSPTLMAELERTLAYAKLKPKFKKKKIDLRLVSAATGEGVRPLLNDLFALVKGLHSKDEDDA